MALAPEFVAAAMRKHNIPAGASLLPAAAAAMFIEIREFAFRLHPVWRAAFVETRVLSPMASWLPPSWTRLYWRSPEVCRDALARWGDIGAREEELQLCLLVGDIVKRRAEMIVRGVRVLKGEGSLGVDSGVTRV